MRSKKRVLIPVERKLFYLVTGILWLTGTIWLGFRYLTGPDSIFESPTQTMLLKIHGAAAMVFLFALGVIFYHIPPGWRKKERRPSGVLLLTICGILILTGWGLYYAGGELFRNWMSWIHSILGVLLPMIIVFHVWKVYQRLKAHRK